MRNQSSENGVTAEDVVLEVLVGAVTHSDETSQAVVLNEFVDQVFVFLQRPILIYISITFVIIFTWNEIQDYDDEWC